MVSFQQKIDVFENEIRYIKKDFSLSQEVSEQEIKNVLDHKNGTPFDQEIFEQLIDRMKEKQSQQMIKTINWKNFIVTYIEAENQLKQKIYNAEKILIDCKKKYKEVQDRLIEAQTKEILNEHGIAENSHLTVTVKNISLNVPSNVEPYVQIQVGPNQKHQTSNAKGNQATFNNTFEFKIVTGQESIQINVMNYERAVQDTLLGSVTISLNFLRDQYPRQNEYQLLGYDKNEIGTIFLSLQWLHSQTKYLSDTQAQWDDHIKQQEEDKRDFEIDLKHLYSPFPQYCQLFRNDMMVSNEQGYYGNTDIAHKLDDQIGVIQQKQPEYERIDLRGVSLQGVIEVDKSIFLLAQFLFAIFLVITLLSHMYRPSFIDWMICLVAILFYQLHIFDHQKTLVLLISIGVSCIFDFFWLFTFSSGWWETVYEDNQIEVIDSSFRRFAVCMSYISFIIKFPLAFAVLQLRRALEEQLSGKTVVKEKLMNTINFNRSPEYAAASVPYGQIYVPPQGYINRQYVVTQQPNQIPFSGPIQQSTYVGGNVQQSVIQQTPFGNYTPSVYKPQVF